jgi:sulfite exporter TauE/SafE
MTPIAGPASRRVVLAAAVLWRALIVVAGLHVYWLLGGTWGVHAGSGGAYSEVTPGLRVYSAVAAALLIVGGLVVRARAGLWKAPLSDRAVRAGMWLLTACLGLAALLNFSASTDVERFVIAPFALLLALLGLVVAASSREWPGIHRRHPPQPSH